MAVRQYIGARYVPKFYEGSNGSSWDQGVMYEPLIIVSYLNNYYTSKKTVPATVGAPNLNPEYWANIGLLGDLENRLGAVEHDVDVIEGKQEVDETNIQSNADHIDKELLHSMFSGKKILILGDSNSIEGEEWRGRTWVTDFKEIMNGVADSVVNNSTSGRCFTSSTTVPSMVQVVDGLSGGDYDFIIMFCGVNDWSSQAAIGTLNSPTEDVTKFDDAMTHCYNTLRYKYPKAAQFWMSPLLTYDYATTTTPLIVYANAIRGITGKFGANFIDGRLAPGYWVDGNTATTYSMDGLHCNAAYAPILAKFIIGAMLTGGTGVSKWSHAMSLALSNKVASGGYAYLIIDEQGNVKFTVNVALATQDYVGFFANNPPDWAINENYVTYFPQWVIKANNTNGVYSPIVTAGGNPYPIDGYNEVGDKYSFIVNYKPQSMNFLSY